jgi:hypothetical protein
LTCGFFHGFYCSNIEQNGSDLNSSLRPCLLYVIVNEWEEAFFWQRAVSHLWLNFRTSMGARNRVGIRLSYRPARLHRLAESIPWNRHLGIDSGVPKSFKMPFLCCDTRRRMRLNKGGWT